MPQRSHLLSAAVLASALASGSVWFWHVKSGGADGRLAGSSSLNTEAPASASPDGSKGKTGGTRSSSSYAGGFERYGRDYAQTASSRSGGENGADSLHGRALSGTTTGGRGLFAPSASRKAPGRGSSSSAHAADAVSEAELQSRAAQVEQEANHDLKRLVKLLDLDEQQQDRIFQTLASRSADWHPLMRTTTLSPEFPSVGGNGSDTGNSITANQPGVSGGGPGNGNTTVESPAASVSDPSFSSGKTGNSTTGTNADHSTSADSGNLAVNGPQTQPPLVDVLAPELTKEQQAQLAEEEMDREEWWESIIPRLLPDEDQLESDTDTGSDGVYAVPPETGSDSSGSSGSSGTSGANSVSPTTPGAQ